MRSITVSEHCFDEEFLISGGFACYEFNGALDDLLFFDIHHRESVTNLALVLDVSWKTEKQVSYCLDSYLFEFLYVGISGM